MCNCRWNGALPFFGCHFCYRELPDLEASDPRIDDLIAAKWACYAERFLRFEDLCELEHVCVECAERLVGPDWLQIGRAANAREEAFEAAVRSVSALEGPTRIQ